MEYTPRRAQSGEGETVEGNSGKERNDGSVRRRQRHAERGIRKKKVNIHKSGTEVRFQEIRKSTGKRSRRDLASPAQWAGSEGT